MYKVEKNVSLKAIANLLKYDKIVLFFNGRSEAGCRALGNRSVLSNPATPYGKQIVNFHKNREWFRPLAASILEEHVEQWFFTKNIKISPFMTNIFFVKDCQKYKIPNALHVDGSCRLQTVNIHQNQNYYNLIQEFHTLTNIPLIVNTSFNLAGQPIVETPKDAIDVFVNSNLPYLYFADVKCLLKK